MKGGVHLVVILLILKGYRLSPKQPAPKSTAHCCCPKPGSLSCQTSQSCHLKAGSSTPTNPWKSRWRFPWEWCREWSALTEAAILQEMIITITCLSSPILRLLVLYDFIRFNLDFFFWVCCTVKTQQHFVYVLGIKICWFNAKSATFYNNYVSRTLGEIVAIILIITDIQWAN